MKDIIQELNDYNVPIIKIDDTLAKVKYENLFSQKLADANAFLAKAGVPKSFTKYFDDKPLLTTQSFTNIQDKQIRRIFHNGEWWFSIIDIISSLTDSKNPSSYWSMMKNQEKDLLLISQKLQLLSENNNKQYFTDCANTEGILRIVMSIPSPKAEPLQQWLAQLGREHIEEIDNFDLDLNRLTELYKIKGYPLEWIQQRFITIEIRKRFIEQCRERGVNDGQEFDILSAEISKNTFGLTPKEYSQFKSLDKGHLLRDNMTATELHFAALGEQYTLKEILEKDAFGFKENREAAILGGNLAGIDLKKMEQKQGIKVVSNQNFMHLLKGGTMINLDRVLL